LLVAVTFTAAYQKIFSAEPRVGFLAHARQLAANGGAGHETLQLIANDRLDAAVTAGLVILVALMLVNSVSEWVRVLAGRKQPRCSETPFVATHFVAET
jgi:carbon starvation protein